MKFILILLFISTLFFSCNNRDNNTPTHPLDQLTEGKSKSKPTQPINLFQLNWMEGIWIDSLSIPNNVIIENWKVEGDTIFGKRGTIKNNDTTYSQLSKIYIYNDQPIYLLEQEGSAFVSFKTKEFSSTRITFGNIANAAPTQISYEQKNQNLGLEFITVTQAGNRTIKQLFTPLKK